MSDKILISWQQYGNRWSVPGFPLTMRIGKPICGLLTGYARTHAMQIWAYCLMDNHVHLLAVPETEIALARGIGLTNQVYTQYLNRKLSQSGRGGWHGCPDR